MKIGELAEAVGISTQAIRYYERRGLLVKPPRTEGGFRDYGPGALETLTFILEAKTAGFTLKEIKQLADIDPGAPQSCSLMQELLRKKLIDLDEKMGVLKRIRKRLSVLKEQCDRQEENSACPVLQEFCEQ